MNKTGTPVGGYAPDFELPGTDDSVHHLARYLERHQAVGVVFMCNHCPYVRLYLERLKQLQQEFEPQGLTLIGINPNDADRYPDDSFENMKSFAAAHQLNFPYLRDVTQDVAQSFGATTTPHVFLINRDGVICYSGGIDDNVQDASSVTVPYLRNAIQQVLEGASVVASQSQPIGCSVKWRT